jgi:hypothetical protein
MVYTSLAPELITSFPTKVAQILVQSRLHNDTGQPFCQHLLVASFAKDSNPKITCVESRNHQQEVMMKRATWIQSDPSVSQWLVISCSYPVKTKDTQEGSKMCRFQALFGVGMAEIAFHSTAVIPNQESARQWIHPDWPFQDTLPLYLVFVALQNVTEDMGPTSYLMGTHQTMETATGSMGPLKQSWLVVSSHAHHIPL